MCAYFPDLDKGDEERRDRIRDGDLATGQGEEVAAPGASTGEVELCGWVGHDDVANECVQVRVGRQELPQGEAAGPELLELLGTQTVELVGTVEVRDLRQCVDDSGLHWRIDPRDGVDAADVELLLPRERRGDD